MCDIKPLYVWHHMNSMLYYSLFYWHPKLYSWHHMDNIPEYRADCIGHNIHYTCDTTATVTMTRHCNVFDMILSVYEISHAEWMTTQPLYLTWYPMYLCNQTHFTNDITPYVRMKQHSLHAWHHSYFTWHHIHACWQHTIVSMSWHKLCLWHHMYYIWCHPYCVYDKHSSISVLRHVKTDIYSTPYVITPSLLKISHLLCKISQAPYVCHHSVYTGHDIHILWQPLLFITSHALYSFHHTHYIWHLIYSVWCHFHYVCYITQWPYLWHQTLYVYVIFTWYGIRHSVMTTKPFCAFPATMRDVTLNVFLTWHTMYQFFERKWMYVITASICMTSYALHMTSHPLFMTSHHWRNHITSSALITSHTQYMT